MVEIHLRSGKTLKVSNEYSTIESFILNKPDDAMVFTHHAYLNKQYLIRREAIDYIENKLTKDEENE